MAVVARCDHHHACEVHRETEWRSGSESTASAGWDGWRCARGGAADLEFVHINEVAGGPETAAHLLTFDSVHGRWTRRVETVGGQLEIDGAAVAFSAVREAR